MLLLVLNTFCVIVDTEPRVRTTLGAYYRAFEHALRVWTCVEERPSRWGYVASLGRNQREKCLRDARCRGAVAPTPRGGRADAAGAMLRDAAGRAAPRSVSAQ